MGHITRPMSWHIYVWIYYSLFGFLLLLSYLAYFSLFSLMLSLLSRVAFDAFYIESSSVPSLLYSGTTYRLENTLWETTRSTFEQVPIELVFVELYTISHLFSKYRVIYHHHHRTATTAWHEWLTHSRERRNNDKTFLLLLLFCNTEWSDEGGDSSSSIFYICFYYYFLLFFFTLRRIACIRDLSALLRARRQ